jgi:hypothetical protein
VEFPNAEFDLCLTDSFGRDHHIRREAMVYKTQGELVTLA